MTEQGKEDQLWHSGDGAVVLNRVCRVVLTEKGDTWPKIWGPQTWGYQSAHQKTSSKFWSNQIAVELNHRQLCQSLAVWPKSESFHSVLRSPNHNMRWYLLGLLFSVIIKWGFIYTMLSIVYGTQSALSRWWLLSRFAAVAAAMAVISLPWCFDNSTDGFEEKVKYLVLLSICYVSLGRLSSFSRAYFPFFIKEN